jgi:PqqD family protein of HPr-rel-A system
LIEGSEPFSSVWVARDFDALLWAQWPDACTIFHRPSGKTHLLNPSSAWLLRRLAVGPLSAQAAALELAAQHGTAVSSEFCTEVERVLLRFGQLGLARCVKKS